MIYVGTVFKKGKQKNLQDLTISANSADLLCTMELAEGRRIGGRSQNWWKFAELVEARRRGGRSQNWWKVAELVEGCRIGGRSQNWWKVAELVEGRCFCLYNFFFKK